MKRFSLFAANLAGTAVLADLVRYLQASTVTRLLILLIVIAIIAYFCWSGGKRRKKRLFLRFRRRFSYDHGFADFDRTFLPDVLYGRNYCFVFDQCFRLLGVGRDFDVIFRRTTTAENFLISASMRLKSPGLFDPGPFSLETKD